MRSGRGRRMHLALLQTSQGLESMAGDPVVLPVAFCLWKQFKVKAKMNIEYRTRNIELRTFLFIALCCVNTGNKYRN